jgi:subtilisin family serine protease
VAQRGYFNVVEAAMPSGDQPSFHEGHGLRVRRIYQQWKAGRRVREPGVVRGGPNGEPELDVLIELAPGASPPELLRPLGRHSEGDVFISAAVDIRDLERLAHDGRVLRIEAARRLSRTLAHSVPEIRANSLSLATEFPDARPPYDGKGVIVGILDVGCDVAHPNFCRNGRTRILSLWRQATGATPRPPAEYNYGMEYKKDVIDQALANGEPYGSLMGDVRPEEGSHGTNVMDIAAGSGAAPGVAPNADLIFVEVDTDDVGKEDFIGNSARLWQAADYVFKQAEALGKPAVVNISLGTNGGPHDGSALVDQQLGKLLDKPGRAIVIAAGNAFDAKCHASGHLDPGNSRTLTWTVVPKDDTGNELEVWYSGGPLAVFLTKPDGTDEHGPVALGHSEKFLLPGLCIVNHDRVAANGANRINIFIEKPPPAGDWLVRLENVGATEAVFDAWIERDGGNATQSRFADADADHERTLGSISCGVGPIVVGSYASDAVPPAISVFSAAGTTRDGRQKPDVSAPGENDPGQGILAAEAVTKGLVRIRGTSQAAPHVTGLIALMMQASPTALTIDKIRDALIASARPVAGGWDPRAGFGRIDAAGAISKVLGP